ncbi:MAG: ABC transporter permease [Alkalibacterium sp.]|uniref:ABC-2 type transport system permease protein n=1 Tax=Alkalibacterium gilvum TaxID=1130080 RepID=A0A1H6TDN4_9LACT|nr:MULTISPECIES: ABC transporter permease [Alkalibacterium]MDN6193843.1 ABC transporter permease [Alkalibacterium sp.]MDN6294401.1 ABC transporter permease [Alkalibacterium sp.]MDN6296063.1 ABC transporter permease [Alkalibacterium sp.]MDN6327327.1 ABC transporter permease [Alkalibacterium sp.]MDN6398043.1 ABC transporter permease [Alkalibacterium sp.]
MNKYWVITKEVYKKNIKSFGFIAMVLSPLVLVAVVAGITYYFSQEEQTEPDTQIAVISENETINQIFSSQDWDFQIDDDIKEESEAEEALLDESISGYLTAEVENGTVNAELVYTDDFSDQSSIIQESLSNFQTMLRADELNLGQEDVAKLSEPVTLVEQHVDIEEGSLTEEDFSDTIVQQGSAYFVSIAIMIFIMTYAGIIAEEVANEKGTRIMEIILSSASATNHFFGKLTGVMLVLLTQITIYAVIGFGAYIYFKDADIVQSALNQIDLASILQELLGFTIIFFIAGVLMYVVLAAFFGSLATKMEDVNKAVTPIVFMALIGFYIGIFAFTSPDNTFVEVFSYIPLFTPFVMPFRIAAETVSTLGIWLSIIGTIGFAILISFVSLAFYRSNVLIYSDTNLLGTIKRSWSIMQSNRKARKNNSQ